MFLPYLGSLGKVASEEKGQEMVGYAQFSTTQGLILKIHPNQSPQIEKCPQ